MKKFTRRGAGITVPLLIFFSVFVVYFAVATQFTFKPKWALDYYNLMAKSFITGRLDLVNPPTTYDLAGFQGKWYLPMGILPAIWLIPPQLIIGRYIPTLYLSLFFGSLNVVLMYLIIIRLKTEFFPKMRQWEVYLLSVLFAFGTMNFYVSTLGSYWHVNQITSVFWGTLGFYLIFKHRRNNLDYILSVCSISITLIGRTPLIFLVTVPLFFYLWDVYLAGKRNIRIKKLYQGIYIFGLPLGIFSQIFFSWNFLRFKNIFEYGYNYIHEAPNLAQVRLANGITSPLNLINNLRYLFFEIPGIAIKPHLRLLINLNGNSILFLTPPFLAIFWVKIFQKVKNKLTFDPYPTALAIGSITTILPSLLFYSTGWMQFGYRYALDIMPLLIVLSVFGVKGKLNILYVSGTLLAIVFHYLGIQALM